MAKRYSPYSWVSINTVLFPLLLLSQERRDSKPKWPLVPRHTNASCFPVVRLCPPFPWCVSLLVPTPYPCDFLLLDCHLLLLPWTPSSVENCRKHRLSIKVSPLVKGLVHEVAVNSSLLKLEVSGCSNFSRDVIPKKPHGKYQKLGVFHPSLNCSKSTIKTHCVICGTLTFISMGPFMAWMCSVWSEGRNLGESIWSIW